MLTRRDRPWSRVLFPFLLLWVVAPGCDSSTEPVIDEPFLGNWNIESFIFDGDREAVRKQAVAMALEKLLALLL